MSRVRHNPRPVSPPPPAAAPRPRLPQDCCEAHAVLHAALATSTPDDRDREVERMARLGEAAMADDPPWAEAMLAQIVAGLRASGGTE